MRFYATLNDLLKEDEESRALYEHLPKDAQVMLKEQRQDICTYEDLMQTADGLQKHSH